jgi:arylamine N-acetyltransferase
VETASSYASERFHRHLNAEQSAARAAAPSTLAALVLQKLTGDEWADVYGFIPQPIPLIDVETSNWWTSTHPRSLFVTGLIVGVRDDDGTGTSLCDWSELSVREETPAIVPVTC